MNIESCTSCQLEWKSKRKEKTARLSSLGQAGINHVTFFSYYATRSSTVQRRKNISSTGTLFSVSSYPSAIFLQELDAGPTTICFVLFNFDIVSSDRPRFACTTAGGVKASHWTRHGTTCQKPHRYIADCASPVPG